MKSNSISGLAFSFITDTSTVQDTTANIDLIAKDIIQNHNNFYLFSGTVPAKEVLQAYDDVGTLLTNHAANKVLEWKDIDVKYTYDKTKKLRKIQKWPVDAKTFSSAVTGTATWGVMHLTPLLISTTGTFLIFTDAVGGWDDPDQSILLSGTNVTTGEEVIVKDINFTIQDALVRELT